MKELIAKYLRYLSVERNASKHTILSYKNDLNQLLRYTSAERGVDVTSVDINRIDRLTIRLWLGSLSEDGMAKNTIARKVASLRSFFKYCFKRGYIQKNPAHLLIVPKKEQRLPKTVLPEDIHHMMELASGDDPVIVQDRAILELFYSTGIRLNELIVLNITDIDLQNKQLIVQGKGNKQRIVPLGQHAITACTKHLKSRKKLLNSKSTSGDLKALFIAPRGARMNHRKVQRTIRDYFMRVSEITQKSPHILRHSFATHMLDAGADIRLIKEFLGHANLSSTQVYTHTSVEHLRKVYSKAHPRAEL
ncbi:MAG: tyrosine recombinase XerC [Balneolaceae bacterium]|nr:MAG: tyrosine recombinase XerC [Balneolaceae bacterium]